MKNFYVTFGQAHNHNIDGKVFNSETICKIQADDYWRARDIAFDTFGQKWAFLYEDISEQRHLYPDGVVEL